jgi:hypothetical protein
MPRLGSVPRSFSVPLKSAGMAPRPESSAELSGHQRDAAASRNVLSTIASAMFLGSCLLVCGLCATGVYFFEPDVRDDPEAVDPLMAEMLDITVPPEFEKRGVIEWNLGFLMSLRGAYYETPGAESDGMLMFVEVRSFHGNDPDVDAHIRQALREKQGGVVELELVESKEEPLQVRGKPVPFKFETRRDPVEDQTYRVIEGVVEGRGGPVLIGLRVREDAWDDAVAREMIESIH